jgi:hypothetical protein
MHQRSAEIFVNEVEIARPRMVANAKLFADEASQ